MKRQRGFTIPGIPTDLLVILAIAVAVGAAILGVKSYVENWREELIASGAAAERARWQARENQQLVAERKKFDELETKYRALEKRGADDLAKISGHYQKELTDAEAKRRSDVAAVRAGTLRLRDPGRAVTACPDPGGSETAVAAARPGGRDGAATADVPPAVAGVLLSNEASVFLLELASEADAVALQLAAAQAVIVKDREVCR